MHKCPNCRFEPVDGLETCPNCGFSLVSDNDTSPKDKNDEIEWSELSQMSVESVQEMFAENEASTTEENEKAQSETNVDDTNPILAQYIREHRGEYIPRRDVGPQPAIEKEENTAPEEVETTESESKKELEEIVEEDKTTTALAEDSSQESEPVTAVNTEIDPEPMGAKAEESEPVFEPETLAASSEATTSFVRPPKKNRKKWYIALAAVAVLGVGGGYYYHSEKEAEAQRIAEVKKENQEIDALEETIEEFYTDDSLVYLKAEKVGQNTSKLAEEIAKYKGSSRYDDLDASYDRLTDKMTSIQQVNALFTNPAINGEKLADNLQLKADQPVNLTINTSDQKFNELLDQAITQAKEQYDKVDAAKKALNELIQDGTVVEGVTRDQYNAANDAVNAVVNQELVKMQKEDLAKVDQTLTEQEEKAEEERLAAQKAEQEAEEARRNSNTNSGGPNQPIMETDPSQTADLSNAAWGWNPGVRERVIQTCIDRGYIVEGGYYVEPARIENGEGYYNLYATSNQASLTKNMSPSDLPMYVVTINCKTGWFRGNGGN
ncbi:cell division site-positioning protein MapZ family protein [Enterococcus sp. AZ109]|uniref:cell division site-positioning protein MapZ family protein n=1 Tax=Enterococcus sp. AZ109 TaxID=2774634 RepID=UPI003F27222F